MFENHAAERRDHFEIRSDDVRLAHGRRGLFSYADRHAQFKGDALQCTHTTACIDLEINGPVGDAELKLPAIPDGTECRDNRTMKRYALAPDWSRSGPEHDYAVMKVANPNGNAETLDAFVGVTTDSGERRSVWTWIAIVSGGLLIIALFVNVRRKRRLGNLED